jgi:hypothetical protein
MASDQRNTSLSAVQKRSALSALVMSVVALAAPAPCLAGAGSLRIQDTAGNFVTADGALGTALMGAWNRAKPEVCRGLAEKLSAPGDYSAYNVRCELGNDVTVTDVEKTDTGLLLTVAISRSHVTADYTQPFVGQWGDPSAEIWWNSVLKIDMVLVDDATSCPGVAEGQPWPSFEDATIEMVDTESDVDSTVADILGGITGFFGGFLFGGVGAVPLAVAGALGTSAIIEGQAAQHIPQGAFNLGDTANEELEKAFSACDVVSAIGKLRPPLTVLSYSADLITLVARRAAIQVDDFRTPLHEGTVNADSREYFVRTNDPSVSGGTRETTLTCSEELQEGQAVLREGAGSLSLDKGALYTNVTLAYGGFTRPVDPNVGGPLLGMDLTPYTDLQLDFARLDEPLTVNITYYTSNPLDPEQPRYYSAAGHVVTPSQRGAALTVQVPLWEDAAFNWKQVDGVYIQLTNTPSEPSSFSLRSLAFQ